MRPNQVRGDAILNLLSTIDKSHHKQSLIPFDGIAIWHRRYYRPNSIEVFNKTEPRFKINENDICRAYILL